ncbi:MAG: site-specific DNA-methyltransferase [Candidatus Moeniiplasma glomeromycotorum]|nr:site-specific DNA-methyltransferase [Candidatus Moeniiplasma glomeromycotorum]MCE8167749.1 site-specific DNA-methyltransferase [Candidatus Moeniiplasma glomeromycotorum]MCE8169149.1 site-specific DNA-methyltransferase [Candidatus Moeniiplasma glomeromycotorum]
MKKFKSKIIEGDVIKVLKKLDKNNKFDVIIADPPYNIGKDFGNNIDYKELQNYINWTKNWIEQCLELLSDDGLIYVYGFSEILARVASQFPLEKQRFLIWYYTNKTSPSSNFWQRSHEAILCLWKNKRPNLEINQIREPYSSEYLKFNGKERTNTKGRFGNKITTYKVNGKGALPRDVITVPALAGGAGMVERHFMCKDCDKNLYHSREKKNHENHNLITHPTQKPIQLAERLIFSRINGDHRSSNLLKKGAGYKGRVLVPFVGSGSECIVAEVHNIEYVGIEINPEYIEYANKWIELIKDNKQRAMNKNNLKIENNNV